MLPLAGYGMKEIEQELCERHGVSTDVLMEVAGTAVAEVVLKHGVSIVGLIAGPGHNGGDALTAGRHLIDRGIKLIIFSLQKQSPKLTYLLSHGAQLCENMKPLRDADLLLDGLMGYGFRPPIRDQLAEYVEEMNQMGIPILSIDLPSGLPPEGTVSEVTVRASETVFLGLPKRNSVTGLGLLASGEWSYHGLGFEAFFRSVKTGAYLVEGKDVSEMARRYSRRPYHKRDAGQVTAVVGSSKYRGAALLVAQTLIAMGAGLIHVKSSHDVENWLVANHPQLIIGDAAGSFVIGPGLEDLDLARNYAAREGPKVIDASALRSEVLDVARDAIITPHEGEAARLLGVDVEKIRSNRFEAASALYDKFGSVVLLKGPGTIIYDGENWFVIPLAAYQLATGGTGDVLSGVIGFLLSRGMPLRDAGIVGSYLHAITALRWPHGLDLNQFIDELARKWWQEYEH